MKKNYNVKFLVGSLSAVFLLSVSITLRAQNIAVNTTGTAAAAANLFEVTQPAGAANNSVGIFASHLGTATNAYAIWAEATGATNKYAIVVPSGGGYVGIGTAAPQRALHIVGPEGAVSSFPSAALGSRDMILLENNQNANMAFIAGGAGNQSMIRFLKSADASTTGWLNYDHNGNYMSMGTVATERVRIDNAGEVGIGTTNPLTKLHVYSGASGNTVATTYSQLAIEHSGDAGIMISNPNANIGRILFGTPGRQYGGLIRWDYTNANLDFGTDLATGNIRFLTGTFSERMRINSAGNVGIATTTPSYTLDVNGTSGFNAIHKIGPVVNNPEHGMWNPIWTAISAGQPVYTDEEFATGANSVAVYNNLGGTGVVHTWENGDGSQPNTSGKWIRIDNDGTATSPGYGGFYQGITSRRNATIVQRFRAKLPVGYTLNIAENSQGTNKTSYWLTPQIGTGKWEEYIRVSHCGNTGAFGSGGHVYVSGTVPTFTWYLASCNAYEVGTPSFGASNNNYIKNQTAAAQTTANFWISGNARADGNFVSGGNTVIDAGGGWHRTYGNTGWYNSTHQGGWYMADATWIRSYNSKDVYINTFLRADGGIASGGLATPGAGAISATSFINSNTGFRISNAAASGTFLRGNGTNYVSSAILAADIPAGSGNYIQNQYAVAQGSNYWISGEAKIGSWFRNSAAGTGLYNEATTAGIYSPSASLMSTYNNSAFQITGASVAAGNLRFSAANPYITASSYFIAPGGAYFNSGTVYFQSQLQARGGVHNDAAAYLTIAGGTSAFTSFTGGVGINGVTTSTYALEVNGRIKSTSVNESSDIRWKKDISALDNALAKVKDLRGVNYKWRTDEFKDKEFDSDTQIGLIAQEVEKIYPELVCTDNDGFKSVEYSKLVAVLIEAIKEQQKIIEDQRSDFEAMKSDNQQIKASNLMMSKDMNTLKGAMELLLKQNNLATTK